MKGSIIWYVAIGVPAVVLLSGFGQKDVSYSKEVQPILQERCAECHLNGGQGHEASGFLIESYDSLMQGTQFGPVVVPGDSISSSLYRLVAGEVHRSIRMPHRKEPVGDRELAKIERWIEQGAQNN